MVRKSKDVPPDSMNMLACDVFKEPPDVFVNYDTRAGMELGIEGIVASLQSTEEIAWIIDAPQKAAKNSILDVLEPRFCIEADPLSPVAFCALLLYSIISTRYGGGGYQIV